MFKADNIFYVNNLKKKNRYWRSFSFILLCLLIVVIGKYYFFSANSNNSIFDKEHIALINIENVILENPKRDNKIKDLSKNKNILAVIIRINSPGGTVVGSESLLKALQTLAKEKFLISVITGVGASGAYMASLAGKKIFASEASITGSIGVVLQSYEMVNLAKIIGINPVIIKSSPYKAVPNPLEKMNDVQQQYLQEMVTDNYNFFVNIVAENRKNLTKEEVYKLSNGKIYTGKQAIKNGLIDKIGGVEEGKKWLIKQENLDKNIGIHEYSIKTKSKRNLMDFISKILIGEEINSLKLRFKQAGLWAIWGI